MTTETASLAVRFYLHKHGVNDIPDISNSIADAHTFFTAKHYDKRVVIAENAFIAASEAAKIRRMLRNGSSIVEAYLLFDAPSNLVRKNPSLALKIAQDHWPKNGLHKMESMTAFDNLRKRIKFDYETEYLPDDKVKELRDLDQQEKRLKQSIDGDPQPLSDAEHLDLVSELVAKKISVAAAKTRVRNQAYADIINGLLLDSFKQDRSAAIFVPVGIRHRTIAEHMSIRRPQGLPEPDITYGTTNGLFDDTMEADYHHKAEFDENFFDLPLARQVLVEDMCYRILQIKGYSYSESLRLAAGAVTDRTHLSELLKSIADVNNITDYGNR